MVVRKYREVKNSCGIEERSVSGNCKDDFLKSTGGIGRGKLIKVEEKIFGGDCRVVVCTSSVVKMKEKQPFCKEFSLLCIKDRAVVDRVV